MTRIGSNDHDLKWAPKPRSMEVKIHPRSSLELDVSTSSITGIGCCGEVPRVQTAHITNINRTVINQVGDALLHNSESIDVSKRITTTRIKYGRKQKCQVSVRHEMLLDVPQQV